MFEVLVRHFHSLLVFQTAAESGSFSRAAALLNITQPAVTRSIARLEDALGFRILERQPNGVSPTEFGKALLGYVDSAAREVRQGSQDLNLLVRRRRNAVSCAGSTVNMTMIAAAAHRLGHRSDGRTLHLFEGTTPLMLRLLKDGELDFVVGSHISEPVDEEFATEPLLNERIGIYAATNHPARDEEPASVAALLQTAQWIIPDSGTHLYAYITSELTKRGLELPTKLIESRSVSAIRWTVQNTDSVSFGTSLLHLPELLSGEVRPLKTDWDFPVTKHTVYRRPRRMMSRAALELIDAIKIEAKATQTKLTQLGL